MATMPLRQYAQQTYRRPAVNARPAEAHWFFIIGFFLAYTLCRMLT
jgi:hypothetical protein